MVAFLFVCFKAKENPEQGCGLETMHGKHFPYFSAKTCTGQGQELFGGGEIHSKHGNLKG